MRFPANIHIFFFEIRERVNEETAEQLNRLSSLDRY